MKAKFMAGTILGCLSFFCASAEDIKGVVTNVIDGNTIVIQRLVPRIILRKGNYVASVINKSFDINGGTDNTTGTIAPDVKRVIKEEQQ